MILLVALAVLDMCTKYYIFWAIDRLQKRTPPPVSLSIKFQMNDEM